MSENLRPIDPPHTKTCASDDCPFVSAQPMSPTMRQAVAEAKQRPPARHFEPSTLLEDGERDG